MPDAQWVKTEPLQELVRGRGLRDIAPLAEAYIERFGVPSRQAHSAFEAVFYGKSKTIHEQTADRLCAVLDVPFRAVYPDGGLVRRSV